MRSIDGNPGPGKLIFCRSMKISLISCWRQCEMIMSNIGTIASSLPASTAASAGIASTQVRILSFTNTIIRFLVGPLADYLSPVSLFAGTASVKKRPVSRVVFLIASTALLALTLLITELFVRSQRTLWILT